MSRPPIALLCTVLLIAVLAAAGPTWAGDSQNAKSDLHDDQQQRQHQQQDGQRQSRSREQQQQQQQQLVEVSPDLENQLQQAKRLNERDSYDDELRLPGEAYRYELVRPQATHEMFTISGSGGDERPIVQTGNWFDRVQLGNNQKRRSASAGAGFSWLPGGTTNSLRYSRGLPRYYHTKEDEAKYSAMPLLLGDQKEDKAYAFATLPSGIEIINNGESASRGSLWSSRQLRDLLIAQEAANRGRRLEQLARAAMADRRLKAASKINRAGADENINGIDFLQTREKKRRCKVDPNLGVKNPSFCDTDAYFGAADYSMRDVWDSAGKR